MDRFERSREATRNICDALGMKPLTTDLVKWWEIVTTTLTTRNKPERLYVPWQGLTPPTPSGTAPVSALLDLPYIDLLTEDLIDFIDLLHFLEEGLSDEGLNGDAKFWLGDLRETVTDISSVCNI